MRADRSIDRSARQATVQRTGPVSGGRRPACSFFCLFVTLLTTVNLLCVFEFYETTIITTLSGGSLGSCVDEERSQLREVM